MARPRKQKSQPETETETAQNVPESAETEETKKPTILATGLEDYARWKTMFKDRSPENDPPYRRGRIWA